MKHLRRATLALALLSVIYIVGCDGGIGGGGDTTVQEDIANIEASLDGALGAVAALESGDFSSAVQAFTQINDGEIDSDWAGDVVEELSEVLDFDDVERDLAFDFASNTGVYEWSTSQGSWSRTGSSGDIVLRFPSSESRSTNNAELTLSRYSDTPVTVDGERYRLPTAVEARIDVDGDRLFEIDLRNVSYDGGYDIPVPTSLDLDVFTAPFSHRLSLRRTSSTDYDVAVRVDDGSGDRVVEVDMEVELEHSDYDELELEDVVRVNGFVALGEDLRVEGDGRPGAIEALEDPTDTEINGLFSATVRYDGQEIGMLEWREAEEDLVVVYKDDTSEVAARYYESFRDRLEAIVDDYTGSW